MYNYLFYKSYKLGLRLKSWEDSPFLLALGVVASTAIMNIATITMIIDRLVTTNMSAESFSFLSKYKYMVAIFILVVLAFYYRFNKRWKTIILRYEKKEKENVKIIHPAIPVLTIFIVSFILGTLASMYKTGDLW